MLKPIILLFIAFIAATSVIQAQDTHFTQFYAAPLTLNPALTGAFEGKYRVGTIYRDQWRRVLDAPLKTFALAADLRFNASSRTTKKDAIGLGLLFFNDKASLLDFSTVQIAVSMAYHKSLDYENTQFLTLGVQGGLTKRNLNVNALQFHDQFDGINGYVLPTSENITRNIFSFPDFNVGLNYAARVNKSTGLFAGVSYHHFTSPNISFYENDTKGDKLYPKISAQVSASLPINNRVSVLPRLLVASQNNHLEMNTGANLRFAMGEYGGSGLHVGSWIRPVKSDAGFGVDALVLLAGFEYNNILLGLSYDVNLKDLTKYHQGQGAFEISIAYLGNYDNEEILCPKF